MPTERIQARPTIYNGFHMRSRLEARFAEWMDGRGWQWAYEPFCYASPAGQYLPDFRVDARGAEYFIEIKPTEQYFTDAMLANGDIIRASKPNAHFGIVIPDWKLYTRESFSDLVEWVTGSRDAQPEPVHYSHVWLPEGPEVNALLLLIHDPESWGRLLPDDRNFVASLFADDTNRAALTVLATDPHPFRASALLRKLGGEKLDGDPADIIAGLVREASRRAIAASEIPIPLAVHQAVVEINEPDTKQAAIDVLLAWLKQDP